MRISNSGNCHCGKVIFSIELPDALDKYSPRKCDCDFCMERNLSYLSHPDGTLEIKCSSPFKVINQGSNQAMFLVCSDCGDVVAVAYPFHDCVKGAVNAGLLNGSADLREPKFVSPKQLVPKEKLNRWNSLWFRVRVNGNDRI